jgi:transcriptional regulator with XRE-family HTH domain
MYPPATFQAARLVTSVQVGERRERPVYFPRLGAYLRGLRTAKQHTDPRWKQQTFAEQSAKAHGLVRLTRQVILRMEKGQVKDPDPDVLRSFADLYGVPFVMVFAEFIQEKYGVDLPRHPVAVTSSPTGRDQIAESTEVSMLRAYIDNVRREFREHLAAMFTVLDAKVGEPVDVPASAHRTRSPKR